MRGVSWPRERRWSPFNLLEANWESMEEVQYATTANNDQNKDREERVTDLVRAPLEGDERKKNEKNGKCCTNSDIKLIFFIMHQSSVLARAYFMQKQVLAFRSLLYFRDIYSDYTLFRGFVSLNSCLQAGHSNKRSEKAKANRNWQFSKRRFLFPTHAQTWQARQAGRPTPFIVTKGIKS